MMRRRRVAWIVLSFARWAWRNRKDAALYELTVIREGQEREDYLRMIQRALAQLARRGCTGSLELLVPKQEQPPVDLDRAWSDLQNREGADL